MKKNRSLGTASYHNFRGWHASPRHQNAQYFESNNESRGLIELDFDTNVDTYTTQPTSFEIPGITGRFTPDVLIQYKDGSYEFREYRVTPLLTDEKREALEKRYDHLARKTGIPYTIRTEKHLSSVRSENLRFFRRFFRTPKQAVLKFIRDNSWLREDIKTYGDIIHSDLGPEVRRNLLAAIAYQILKLDFNQTLANDLTVTWK